MKEIDMTYEDECVTCHHGVSNHAFIAQEHAPGTAPCQVPGCDCKDFIEPDGDVA